MNKLLTFNRWSRDKIEKGIKRCTSRKKIYDDPRVEFILRDVPWWFIKKYLYGHGFEGADSPEELQRVINGCCRKKVKDNEIFQVHFGNFE